MGRSVLALLLAATAVWGAGPPMAKGVPKRAKLYALLVGVNDYSKAKAPMFTSNLEGAVAGTRLLETALKARAGSTYRSVEVTSLTDRKATAKAILGHLGELARVVQPEDCVVLLFSGRATSNIRKVVFRSRSGRSYGSPPAFQFICSDYDPKREGTTLRGSDLLSALKPIRGHVLVLLDLSHSGALCEVATRGLAGGKGKYVLLASAREEQESLEPLLLTTTFPCSFFLIPVLKALEKPNEPLDTMQLFRSVEMGLPTTLRKFDPDLAKGGRFQDKLFQPVVWPIDPYHHWPLFRTSSMPGK